MFIPSVVLVLIVRLVGLLGRSPSIGIRSDTLRRVSLLASSSNEKEKYANQRSSAVAVS